MDRSGYNFQHNSGAGVSTIADSFITEVPTVFELLRKQKNINGFRVSGQILNLSILTVS